MPPRQMNDLELQQTIAEVISNARQREELYLSRSAPLTPAQKEAMRPFFPRRLLDQVRILVLDGERVANPTYHARAKQRGYRLMIDFPHKAVLAHPRLVIFQEKLSLRLLFHGLVHVAQYAVLGREWYLELYVRAFVQTGSYATVPLEVQAFRLDHRYTQDPATPFLVEDEVRHWIDAGNYIISADPIVANSSRD